jgi:hypothetical protein
MAAWSAEVPRIFFSARTQQSIRRPRKSYRPLERRPRNPHAAALRRKKVIHERSMRGLFASCFEITHGPSERDRVLVTPPDALQDGATVLVAPSSGDPR